ncbi:MAG: hypothetical protein QXH42_04615 [Thermoplasmata archaeon]
MKIYIGNNGNVDFDAPVKMTDEQYQNFLSMVRELFSVVVPVDVDGHREERLGDKIFGRPWDLEEYVLLFDAVNVMKVCEALGRTPMSVVIRRGEFIPDFIRYTKNKGVDIFAHPDKILELVKEYLDEKNVQKELFRQRRSRISRLEREKREIEGEISRLKNELNVIREKEAKGIESPVFKNKVSAIKKRLAELEADIAAIVQELSDEGATDRD